MFEANSVPFWTAIAAISAGLTILITVVFSVLTIKLMRDQSAPKVVVFLRHNPERQSLLYIVVRNVGADLATNLKFMPSRPIPAKAFGMPGMAHKPNEIMTEGPLVAGIPALGPGEERVVLWGQFGGIECALEDGPLLLRFAYRQGRRRFKGEADLELASFANTDASEAHIVVAVRHLEAIAKAVGKVASLQDRRTRSQSGSEAHTFDQKVRRRPWRHPRGLRHSQ